MTQDAAELEFIWRSEPPPATTRQPCLANSLILGIGSLPLVHWIFWYSNVAMFLCRRRHLFKDIGHSPRRLSENFVYFYWQYYGLSMNHLEATEAIDIIRKEGLSIPVRAFSVNCSIESCFK